MAIRLTLISSLLLGSFLLTHCKGVSGASDPTSIKEKEITFKDNKKSEDLETIAIFTPVTRSTNMLWKSLIGELGEEFNTATLTMGPDTSPKVIEAHMKKVKPVAVVLLDNMTVKKYRVYQKYYKNDNTPVFIFMTSFLNEIIGLMRNANGIAYEVPGVLSLVRARNILDTEVMKVGAIYRSAFSDYVKQEAVMLKKEKFEMYTARVSDKPTTYELEAALDDLLNKHKIDALWILNDNSLLDLKFIENVWLPTLRDSPMPTVVNVPVLLNPEIEFGSLAIIPDSSAMGVQAANMIFNAFDMDWEMEQGYVEFPLSVLTYIDENAVKKNFGFKEGAQDFIDKRL